MPASNEPEIRVVSHDRLLQLFQAFRDHNDHSFRRAAESIIADELAANHHDFANELRKAIGSSPRTAAHQLNGFRPKDRRGAADLLYFPRVAPEGPRLFLAAGTEKLLNRVLEEHRSRLKLAEHGYRPKSKLLFWGPPGCGKTLTAYYLAQQLGLPLGILRISAAISSYLGETATRLQQVFDAAAETPMVLFFDEVDALAKERDDANDVGELKRVVNSLLQALDAFQGSRSLLVAASNHQKLLDPAVWRRFDAVIHFPMPGQEEREPFLKRLLNGVRVTGALSGSAKAADGLSYADIERAVTEAVKSMILAGRTDLKATEITEEIKTVKEVIAHARV